MEWIMNWWWATVLGPVILGGVIAYALLTRRQLSAGEKARQTDQIRQAYHKTPDEPRER
jgi:hypothetical protein